MTATEVLEASRDKIAKPEDWCRGNFAIDNDGNKTGECGDEAVAWCARGALYNVLDRPTRYGDPTSELLDAASWALFREGLVYVNDNRSHRDVMRVYDRAIQLSKEST